MKKRTVMLAIVSFMMSVFAVSSVSFAADNKDYEKELAKAIIHIDALEAQMALLKEDKITAIDLAVKALEKTKEEGEESDMLAESVIVNATGIYLPYQSWEKYVVEGVPGSYNMAFTESGKYLVLTTRPDTLIVVDVKTGEIIHEETGVENAPLYVEKETAYFALTDNKGVSCLDIGTKKRGFTYNTKDVRGIFSSPESNVLVIDTMNAGNAVIDKKSGKELYKPQTGLLINVDEKDNVYYTSGGINILTYNGSSKAKSVAVKTGTDATCRLAAIHKDRIFMCVDGEEKDAVVCASLGDGTIIWESPFDFYHYNPTQIKIFENENDHEEIVLLSQAGGYWDAPSVCVSFNAETGEAGEECAIESGGVEILSNESGVIRILGYGGIYELYPTLPVAYPITRFERTANAVAYYDDRLLAFFEPHGGVSIHKMESNAVQAEVKEASLPDIMKGYDAYASETCEREGLKATVTGEGRQVKLENKKTEKTVTIEMPAEAGVVIGATFSDDGQYLICAGNASDLAYGLVVSRYATEDGAYIDSLTLDDYLDRTPAISPAGKNKIFLMGFHGAYIISFDDTIREYACLQYEEGNGFGGLLPHYMWYEESENRLYTRGGHSWEEEPVQWMEFLDRDGLIKAGKAYLKKHGR